MRRPFRFASSTLFVAAVIVACGRTGLDLDDPPLDASVDVTSDVRVDARADARLDAPLDVRPDVTIDGPFDALTDAPIFEGGALDVQPECTTPTYCDPLDRGYIYKCGERIFRCSSIEQCAGTTDAGAADSGLQASCVNPCVDTLGQDTSNGCDFYAVETDSIAEVFGSCYAVFVVNQWQSGEPARLQVDRGGAALPIEQFARIPVGTGTGVTYTPYSAARGLGRDEVAVLFLSRDPAAVNDPDTEAPRRLAGCPAGVTPAFVGDAAQHGTGRGQAFRIKSNIPVVAYQMLPFGGGRARATSATLLLPTNVWERNYVAVNASPATAASPTTLAILGGQDGTQVRIRPARDIVGGGGLAAATANVSTTYTVNRGEYLQFTQTEELTGSAIEASGPIAVFGGNTLMSRPLGRLRADTAHQMLPPVSSFGNEYAAVRYRSRARQPPSEESVPWRLVGVVNGTTLSYEPSRPPGAPIALAAGQMMEFDAPGPFVVRSQGATHPFYMAGYMTGGETFNDGEGDPEFVNVIAPAQYLPRYTFFTDPTYPETNLVIVRVKDAGVNRFPDVTLDCAGVLGGWAPVGSSGRYEFTRVDLSSGNFQGQNGCDNGVHRIEATLTGAPQAVVPRIGLTVWGWGNPVTAPAGVAESDPRFTRWVSYGYPGGANITRLNDVVFPAN